MSDLALIKKHLDILPTLDKDSLVKIKVRCQEAMERSKAESSKKTWMMAISQCQKGLDAQSST